VTEGKALEQEKLWVAQALRGDQRAFMNLVDAYKTPVYNLCYRMLGDAVEAEDAAQETFVRVYTHLKAYDPQQKLSSWILSVASHHCIDRLRRRHIGWMSLDDLGQTRWLAGEALRAEETVIERESCAEVQDMLQALPADYRLVIVLRYWQDLSYAEIARVVGSTESAIKSRLHRARRMLAERLIAQEESGTWPSGRIGERKRVSNHAVL
jgi:RNA polymerase sigma-70 factor (ECF subfamily)